MPAPANSVSRIAQLRCQGNAPSTGAATGGISDCGRRRPRRRRPAIPMSASTGIVRRRPHRERGLLRRPGRRTRPSRPGTTREREGIHLPKHAQDASALPVSTRAASTTPIMSSVSRRRHQPRPRRGSGVDSWPRASPRARSRNPRPGRCHARNSSATATTGEPESHVAAGGATSRRGRRSAPMSASRGHRHGEPA